MKATRYKNADVVPQIGDEVYCGPPPQTAIVTAITDPQEPDSCVQNCSVNDRLILNNSADVLLKRSVDGFQPPNQ